MMKQLMRLSIILMLLLLSKPSFVNAHTNMERSTPIQEMKGKLSAAEDRWLYYKIPELKSAIDNFLPEASSKPNIATSTQTSLESKLLETAPSQSNQERGASISNWRNSIYTVLRVLEVLIAIGLAGFIFFRNTIWGFSRGVPPILLSIRAERLLCTAACIAFIASGALHLWIQANQLSGPGLYSIWDRAGKLISSTMIGNAAWIRPALAAAMLGLTWITFKNERLVSAVKVIAAILVVVLFPLTGHAFGSSTGVWYAVITNILHMLAAAVWFGGLAGIWIATRERNDSATNWTMVNALILRFSAIALLTLVTMAISGILLALLRLKSWSALFQSDYGQLVLAKTALMLLVIVIGALHRLVLIPRMAAISTGANPSAEKATNRFLFVVRLEVILTLILFVLAGMLSTTSPPEKSITAEPSYWHVMGDKAHMSFRMKLEATQSYRLDVWLPTGMGAPGNVKVNLSRNDNYGSAIKIPFEFLSGGPDPYGFEGFDKYTYEAIGKFVIETGEWNMSITITDKLDHVHSYNQLIVVS